jgi:Ca-activated chloride channel family protein
MGFLLPDALWLLLLVPALAGTYLLLVRRRHKHALTYSSVRWVKEAARGHPLRRHLPPLLLLAALVALISSISRPTILLPPSHQRTVVLAMDVSVSMGAKDVKPDRLAAAQAAARQFIAEQPGDVRTAIVSFAGFAAVVQSPTRRRDELVAAIDRLRLAPHTAIGSGLLVSLAQIVPEAAIDVEPLMHGPLRLWSNPPGASGAEPRPEAASPRPRSSAAAAIILLSDGSRTVGPSPLYAAEIAANHGVPVYTVGFGRPEGGFVEIGGRSIYVRMDERTLKSIANITGGEYFAARSASDLMKVYQTLSAQVGVQSEETELTALLTATAAILAIAAAGLSLLWFGRVAG